MRKGNIVVSIIMLILGGFVLYTTSTFPETSGNVVGPGFFPSIVAIGLLILGIVLFIQNTVIKSENREVEFFGKDNMKSYLIMLITLVYLIGMSFVGFLVSSIIYLTILMIMYGIGSKVKAVINSAVIVGIVYVVFNNLLSVPLP